MALDEVSAVRDFLADRTGLAADLIRSTDWSRHPLGPPDAWPPTLTTTLRLMLAMPVSLSLVWGPDRSTFFNDASVPILEDRTAGAMGAPLEAIWADSWPIVQPAYLKARAGEASRLENVPITMRRAGRQQETWWTLTFAPLDDGANANSGVLCITTEITARIRSDRAATLSEERNRQIIDSATDFAIIATDLDGRVTRWNEGAHRVLGWTEAEMLGETLARCFLPEDRARGQPVAERQASLGAGGDTDEGWRQRKGGDRFWATGQLTPIRDADDVVIGFVEILRDRTRQRLAAERLAASESRLAEALAELQVANAGLASGMAATAAERDRMWEMSPDLLHVTTNDGVFVRVNPAWTTLLGYDPRDLVGIDARTLLHPDDFAAADAARRAIVDGTAGDATLSRENRVRHRDGSYRWFSWLLVPTPGNRQIYATGRHITLEKEREEKLRDTREFARLALGAIGGVGVWTYDIRADIYYCDSAIAELYGLDPTDGVLGVSRAIFLGNVHEDDRAALDEVLAAGMAGPGDIELEYRLCRSDGTMRWVLSRGHTAFDDAGAPIRRTGIGVDMTRQRLIEEQLRQSQKVEAVGQLTGGVAHDFNNLLTVIRGSVDLLRRPEITEARRARYIDAISDTTDRATKLTSQLLAFARRQALKPEVFDVRDSVAAIEGMLGTLIESRIRLVIDLADQPCSVNADRSQFDTAIVNMVVNARDAMAGEGVLTIRVGAIDAMPALRAHPVLPGAFVTVALTDTGTGIVTDQIDRIFEPFFTTKGVGQGTGLGLSQVFGFAKQSGGDVIADSVLGEGATFTLYLPQVEAVAPAKPTAIDPRIPAIGAGACVLVVEDNPEVGAFATHALAELGYVTRFAGDGAAALAVLETSADAIDIVFSDVVMPGMSGIELAQEIRRRHPSLPVILTSGYSNVLAQSGSHGFPLVQKPYSIDSLSRALRAITDARVGVG